MTPRVFRAPKVPDVFLLFWVVKLLTTGIGESGSDFLGVVSIPLAAAVGVGGFFLALWLQLRAGTYHPVRYWVTVLMVALFGTMIADGPHVALGTPYYVDATIYLVLLCGLLAWWRRSEGTLSVHSITTSRRERFYWGTVLLTFGLGTALGDTTAIDLGLGFAWSIVLFGVLIVVPFVLWRCGLDATIAFWASYVLTRPLGASVADWLGKKPAAGGHGWGDGTVTALGLVLFAALVGYLALTHADVEGPRASPG
ncbi:COG4705 family protein, partial [Nocardioides mangrovicus]|uniref:COG4705 family protein n=1 Tax=Nocardioides mangrovicus TaxID=2478913 RepID=UPI0013144D41